MGEIRCWWADLEPFCVCCSVQSCPESCWRTPASRTMHYVCCISRDMARMECPGNYRSCGHRMGAVCWIEEVDPLGTLFCGYKVLVNRLIQSGLKVSETSALCILLDLIADCPQTTPGRDRGTETARSHSSADVVKLRQDIQSRAGSWHHTWSPRCAGVGWPRVRLGGPGACGVVPASAGVVATPPGSPASVGEPGIDTLGWVPASGIPASRSSCRDTVWG